ncbi:unnamed protein product [Dracunculus medinensis]|uniref:Solute carrier family 25 member 40 n=1 Tax=Dracunculus medinensis TaxID=318479 RepID=A0A0N4UQF9_DRAME|nr:unnamed protein product [Dracunculus medinensis]
MPENRATTNGDNSISIFQQILASSVGAIITSLLMTPFDVVKIRLQQQAHPFVKGSCFLYSNGLMDHLCTACVNSVAKESCEWFQRPSNFTGTKDAFMKITKNEGIRSLWSGLSPTLVMAVPATVLYFSLYENVLDWIRKSYEGNFWSPMIAGSAARLASTTVVSPLEMVRTKMQSERLTYYEINVLMKRSLRLEGWRSFWRGWSPTIMRDLPFSAIYWSSYESSKSQILEWFHWKNTSFSISCLCGGLSGSIAATLTLPFDVIKTHRQITLGQLYGNNSCKTGGNKFNASTFGIMREIVEENGLKALFTGLAPRIAKVAPACAIMIGSYEYAKLLFAKSNK